MKREIKKLTKEEKEEGLTLELVNKIDLRKRCSPAMLRKGEEPVGLLECSKGYWAHTPDGYLKDEKNHLIVFSERECQVARARYLLYHADDEKRKDAERLLEKRKKKIQEKLDIFKKNIEDIRSYKDKDSTMSILTSAFESIMNDEQKAAVRAENERKIACLPEMEKQYAALVAEFEKGNYNYLLDIMGIEKIPNPVTFKFDNEKDMRVLKNTFGADAMEEASYDINKMYARMKVEQDSEV